MTSAGNTEDPELLTDFNDATITGNDAHNALKTLWDKGYVVIKRQKLFDAIRRNSKHCSWTENFVDRATNAWLDQMQSMLGKQVRVTLNYDDPDAIAEGRLLSFDEGGGIVILDDMGFKHYAWPNLKCDEITPDIKTTQ